MSLRLTSSALALAVMTAPAFADVAPEEVWQSWVDYYQSLGYTVTEGGRDKAGGTLTLNDITITGWADSSKVVTKVPQVRLSDAGDGKVRSVFAERMTMDISGTDEDGAEFSVPVVVDMPGNSMLTSGAPQDMTHDFDYPVIDVTLSTIRTNGQDRAIPITFKLENSAGQFHGAPSKYDYRMTSAKLAFQGEVTDENADKVRFQGDMAGLESQGTMIGPARASNLDTDLARAMESGHDIEGALLARALESGLAIEGALKLGSLAATFDFSGKDEDGQPTSGAGKYDGKGLDAGFSMSRDGLGYRVGSDAVAFEMTSPQLPMPIRYGIQSASMDLQLPISRNETPQPFKLAYSLAGLTLGDEMWAMFDPEARLPRDPASLDLDLTGLMKVTVNLLDPRSPASDDEPPADATDDATAEGMDPDAPADDAEAMADAEEAISPPMAPVEVTINQIALDALGAKVSATGSLKAPEGGDINTPLGQVHAEYEGVNGLLDKLGAMGLIPQDQMMGVRMMLAMFAKPVDGNPDKLTTDLDFRDGGQIFANGQQIK
ncbi:MAG: DUF2125 domain-containing protein [Paracoccus sp. (in: a-proteobacteria)]|uniref:DUF2125 domain-containing protein n=1 Tax=Paracoccus sp. TaxID=267 RepID=UPI0039E439BE